MLPGNCAAQAASPSMLGILGALYLPVATTTASKSYRNRQIFAEIYETETYLGPPSCLRRSVPRLDELFQGERPAYVLVISETFLDLLYSCGVRYIRAVIVGVNSVP